MKVGLLLHPQQGVDAVFEEARRADDQGFDSIWLNDHLMEWRGQPGPDGPLDSFTLMTGLGAVTSRTRLAWGMLNLGFRKPALLAKMLATLDRMTHGRVICSVGSGWFKEEYEAYDIPLLEEHDERSAYAREAVQLIKLLWTHPAPERVTFTGRYVRACELPFSPAPYQQPHPPIWIGGDSDVTLGMVKELADGWVMLTSGNPQRLGQVLTSSDWPKRPMTLVKNVRVFVSRNRDEARREARRAFEAQAGASRQRGQETFDDFLAREIAGEPDYCLERLSEIGSWGINYVRLNFDDPRQQEQVAELLLPRLQ